MEALSSALDISMNHISVNNSFSENNYCQKSEDLDKSVEIIKQQLVISSRTEKIKLDIDNTKLDYWTNNKIYWCQKVHDKESKRVIEKRKSTLWTWPKDKKRHFWGNLKTCWNVLSEYSRMCSGKKYLSIKIKGGKEHSKICSYLSTWRNFILNFYK